MNFNIYIDPRNHCGNQDTEQFYFPRKLLLSCYSHLPPTSNPLTTDLFFITIVLSGRSYKWNHTVSNLLRLASFTQHDAFDIRLNCCIDQKRVPFLLLGSIPLHACTIVCLSIY